MRQDGTGKKIERNIVLKSRCKTLLLRWKMAAHYSKLYNNTGVRMIEERQQSKMVVAGSDLIAGHGGLQPVGEDADL